VADFVSCVANADNEFQNRHIRGLRIACKMRDAPTMGFCNIIAQGGRERKQDTALWYSARTGNTHGAAGAI
jgi:hypothetical protein